MAKKKLPYFYKRRLAEVAMLLPKSVYNFKQRFIAEERSIMDREVKNNTHGQRLEIITDRDVHYIADSHMPVNHFNRMKKAFLKGWREGGTHKHGEAEVMKYFAKVSRENDIQNKVQETREIMMTAEEILKEKIKPIFK